MLKDKTANSQCPNCRVTSKDAAHLNKCTNKDRRLILIKCIKEIKEWMIENRTYPEPIKWIPQYLLRQGKENFVDLDEMSRTMRRVGATQDKIGWRYFTVGKIVQPIRNLQELYLLSCPTRLSIDTWMRRLIRKLLNLSHS